jgi:hypothetical protein
MSQYSRYHGCESYLGDMFSEMLAQKYPPLLHTSPRHTCQDSVCHCLVMHFTVSFPFLVWIETPPSGRAVISERSSLASSRRSKLRISVSKWSLQIMFRSFTPAVEAKGTPWCKGSANFSLMLRQNFLFANILLFVILKMAQHCYLCCVVLIL